MTRRMVLALLAAGLLLGLIAPAATAGGFTVVRPGDTYAGKTYAQWSVAWWQWAANISAPNSPVQDPTGANCAVNQAGPVWFLAGTAPSSSPRCVVPFGKAILFPVINGECSQVEGNGTTEAALRACAAGYMDAVTKTVARVDGMAIRLGTPPFHSRFRFASELYTITFAPDNGFGAPAGTGPSVADGYWVLLKPLGKGKHTIDFGGDAPSLPFSIAVHYTVFVR
jgi:hypothetical protein